MKPLELVRERLEQHGCNPRGNGDKFEFCCRRPATGDRRASAGASLGTDGRVLIFCQVCGKEATGEILAQVGLSFSDLYPDDSASNGKREIVATYNYVDEQGELLYQVVRYRPKGFKQRRPDGNGGWVWNLQGTRRVIYQLPTVLKAIEAGEPVIVCEGEADVHAIERKGKVATTNPGGASKGEKSKWLPEYSESLRGAQVVVVADRDEAGRKHASAVAGALQGIAASVRLLEPATGKDVSDHLAAGLELDKLVEIQSDAATVEPERARPVTRASDIRKTRLRWTWRGRLALGYLAVWCGTGGVGKSLAAAWVIRSLSRRELEGEFEGTPHNALIISTEDGRDDMWLPRLEAVGADLERVEFLNYPLNWNVRDGVSLIDEAIGDGTPLVFVDAPMSHMPDPGPGENLRLPTFVRAALQPLADVCRQRKATALFGLHPRKGGGETFADVVQESGVLTQLPRLGLLFGYHPDDRELPHDQQRRVILRGKGPVEN